MHPDWRLLAAVVQQVRAPRPQHGISARQLPRSAHLRILEDGPAIDDHVVGIASAAARILPNRSASNHDLFLRGFPVPSTAPLGCCSDGGSLVGSVDCGPSSCGVRQGPGPSLGAACPLISFTARSQCSCSLPAGHPSRSHMAYARARSCSSLDCCIACSSG